MAKSTRGVRARPQAPRSRLVRSRSNGCGGSSSRPICRAMPGDGWRCSTGTAPTAPTSAARPATSATRARRSIAGSGGSTVIASRRSRTAVAPRAGDAGRPGRPTSCAPSRSSERPIRAGARTSSSSSCAVMGSPCRPRWSDASSAAAPLGRPARTGAPAHGCPAAALAAAVRHPPAARLVGHPTGRPGRARHPSHPAPARQRLEAVHRPRRGQPLGCRRARVDESDRGERGRGPRSPGRADAVRGARHQHRQRL